MHKFLILLGCCCAVVGCSSSDLTSTGQTGQSHSSDKESLAVMGDYLIGQPVRHGNLTIFPVSSKTPKLDDRYITLDEGLKSGTIEILETGANAEQAPNAPAAQQVDNEADPAANDDPLPAAPAPAQETPAPTEVPQTTAQTSIDDAQTEQTPLNLDPSFIQNGTAANQVNQLMVVNRSDRPLYLMPGEIIIGGSQDRTIGQELVVQPDGKPVPIAVFCVEHGRWGQRAESATAEALQIALANSSNAASVSIAASTDGVDIAGNIEAAAAEANKGKFVSSVGQAPKSVLYAAKVAKNQSEVWNQVSAENDKTGLKPESGTFVGNYVDGDTVASFEPYLEKLQSPIADSENIVGVIVAINGKVEMIDVFESTPLFRKLWPKLLKSYSFDAANVAGEKNAAAVCSQAAACTFMKDSLTAPVSESGVDKGIAVTSRTTDHAVTISASVANPAAAPAAETLPSDIHTSVLAR